MNKTTVKFLATIMCFFTFSNVLKAQGSIASVPYFCDFESYTERQQWQLMNGSEPNKWYIDTLGANGGTHGLYISDDDGLSHEYSPAQNSSTWAVRRIALNPGLYNVSFDWKANGYSTTHYMRAYLVPVSSFTGAGAGSATGFTATGSPANWIPIDGSVSGAKMNLNSRWTNTYIGNLRITQQGLYYLVFGWTNNIYNSNPTSYQPPAAVDNIQITVATCPRPDNMSGIAVSTNGDADITWNETGNAHQWIFEYGTSSSFTNARTLVLPNRSTDTTNYPTLKQRLAGLIANTSYYIRIRSVCDTTDTSMYSQTYEFRYCPNIAGCIDFADLTDSSVVCTYGTYNNYNSYTASYPGPYANVGIVDYGYLSGESRHTVHTDPLQYDSCSGYHLQVIPSNACKTVRLGNWKINYQCESITYNIQIDTNDYDIILLNYAIVMHNPSGHPANQQPRFTMEILDQNDQLIDPTCGKADFSSANAVQLGLAGGWHDAASGGAPTSSSNIIYKDWTPVGLNVSAYHGQRIKVRLTTFDCGQSAHFGYAYFNLGCTKARITSSSCGAGATVSTLSAPPGFNYRWYTSRDTTQIVSTAQTTTIQLDSTMYFCEVSFVDNPACKFTMSTMATTRFPHAKFRGSMVNDSCRYTMTFTNQSYISVDAFDTNATGLCEEFYWDFGDGTTSRLENPVHTYDAPGTYTVTLVAMLNDGACTDTISHRYTFTRPAIGHIIAPSRVCFGDTAFLRGSDPTFVSHLWSTGYNRDSLYVVPDSTTRYFVVVRDAIGCVDTLWHTVQVRDCSIYDTTCRNERYVSFGFNLNENTIRRYADTTVLFQNHMRSSFGQDSVTNLYLTIWDTSETIIYDTFCVGTNYMFYGVPLPNGGTYSKRFSDIHGCDSVIYLNLHELAHPTLQLSHDYVPCFNYPINIDAVSNGDFIYWTSNPFDSTLLGHDTDFHLTVTPKERTVYTATTGLNGYNCTTTKSITINMEARLEAYIIPSRQTANLENLQVVFTDHSVGNNGRTWYLNDYNDSVGNAPTYVYTFDPEEDSVKVLLVIYNEGNCHDTTSITIPLYKTNLFAPTVFTPEESDNNTFKISVREPVTFELSIYNRAGLMVFHTFDPNEGWNGGVNNDLSRPCNQESYVYRVIYQSRTEPDKIFDQIGSVILLR